MRLIATGPADAVASPYRLVVTGLGPLVFEIDAPRSLTQPAVVKPDHWQLPGLEARIAANAPGVIESAGERVLVRYMGEAGLQLRIVLDLRQVW